MLEEILSSSHYLLHRVYNSPLHQQLWVPTTIDPFNSQRHYFNHLLMPSETNPLLVHKFPWVNCILQIQSMCPNPCLRIRYGLKSSLLTSHLDVLQMQVFSQWTFFFHFWKSKHSNFVDMENLMLLFVIGFQCFSSICIFLILMLPFYFEYKNFNFLF